MSISLTSETTNTVNPADAAVFSKCGNYRYLLTRKLVDDPGIGRKCLFIMLNPSTADAESDDPTIRRCIGFARRWGMAELRVVNLFALRTHDPRQLLSPTNPLDPVGLENDRVIAEELESVDLIVEAWGNHGTFGDRSSEVRSLISNQASKAWHLGLNVTGEPRHPLYVRANAVLSPARL